jgi:hypothetical protein
MIAERPALMLCMPQRQTPVAANIRRHDLNVRPTLKLY